MGASLVFVALAISMRVSQNWRVDKSFGDPPLGPLSASPIEMDLLYTNRKQDASPSGIWGNISGPLPTNSWYLVSERLTGLDFVLNWTTLLTPFSLCRTWYRIEPSINRMILRESTLYLTLSTLHQQTKWLAFVYTGL